MKTLIIYDSLHGNTAKVAQAIGGALAGEVSVRRAGGVSAAEVKAVDLLIVGSPTHGGWFTEAIKGWLDQVPATALQGIRVAAFDTRPPPRDWAASLAARRPGSRTDSRKRAVRSWRRRQAFSSKGLKAH